MSSSHALQKSSQGGAKTIFSVTSGNFLEMYDFMVYGYYATAIAKTFFPGDDPFASLMLALLTVFGAGFLMRPLGAIVLGAYIDHHGRRKGLILTLGLMALGTLAVAVVPGYATIGAAAPILVLLGRLLQGFSAGVELGGVSVYLSEIAPKGRKGFYVSWQSGSQQVAVVFAALLGVVLNHLLAEDAVTELGLARAVRDRLPDRAVPVLDPPHAGRDRSVQPAQIASVYGPDCAFSGAELGAGAGRHADGGHHHGDVLHDHGLHADLRQGGTVLMMSDKQSFLVTLCVGLSNLFWLPVMGALSDRVGRRPVLITFTVLTILTTYPVLHGLVGSPTFAHLLEVELWLSFLYASYNGAMVVALTEVMPAEVRAAGFSLAYSLATALFGGFTPAISSYLIHATGDKAMPGVWLSFAAVCGLVGTLLIGRMVKQYQARHSATVVGASL